MVLKQSRGENRKGEDGKGRDGLLQAYRSVLLPTVRGNAQVTLTRLTFSYVYVSLPPVAKERSEKQKKCCIFK